MSLKDNRFVQNLKRQAEENPVVVMVATAALLTATAKLLDANTQRSYAKTHAREVERRIHKTYAS
jgi:hypothetical protein